MYACTNGNRRMPSTQNAPRDEELMRQVAEGSAEALGLLHRRFARLIFRLAVRTIDRAAAEDLVQDVFLVVWRNAGRFDPERGTVRAWILQIAHFRLLNELRRRSRQPEIVPDPEGLLLAGFPTGDPGPAETAWQRHRRAVLQSALDSLPPPRAARRGHCRGHLLALPAGAGWTDVPGVGAARGHVDLTRHRGARRRRERPSHRRRPDTRRPAR